MIIIAVHLYAVSGAEAAMRIYEGKALRIFRKHGGEVLAAFKPAPEANGKPSPDEIQILRMASRDAFARFMVDPERVNLSEERKRAIAKTEVFISQTHVEYPE